MEEGAMEALRSLSPIYTEDDLDPNVEYNHQTLRIFKEKLEPTEEDVRRKLTKNEMTELCIKVKCRVDAYRWNPVNDYKRYLEETGRFVGKSPQKQRRLVAKAVNRHIKTMKYNEDEIKKTRRREWVLQKKDNLLSLDLWAYERENMTDNEPEQPPEAMDIESEYEVVTDEHNLQQSELQQQSPSAIATTTQIPQSDLLLSQTLGEDEETEVSDNIDAEINGINIGQRAAEMTDTNEVHEMGDDRELSHIYETNDETDGEYNSAELYKRGGDKEALVAFEVNTESMTLADSNESLVPISTQQSDMQSQDVLSNNYDDFDTGVPLTSTQSQEVLEK